MPIFHALYALPSITIYKNTQNKKKGVTKQNRKRLIQIKKDPYKISLHT